MDSEYNAEDNAFIKEKLSINEDCANSDEPSTLDTIKNNSINSNCVDEQENYEMEPHEEILEEEDEVIDHILEDEVEELVEEIDVVEAVEYLQDDEEAETIVPENDKQIKALAIDKTTPTSKTINDVEEKTVAHEQQENDDESDEPTSSLRAKRRKEEEHIDEEQCRICMTKDHLVSLFKTVEQQQTIADLLMIICPAISIAIKDFLPQFICSPCLDKVVAAVQLKQQCERTETELRKKLSRHKNKIRRPTGGYVTIDAILDSDPASEEEFNNDDEFKVSEDSTSPDEDSDDTDFSGDRQRRVRGAGSRRGKRRKTGTPTEPKRSKSKLSEKHDFSDEENHANMKRKRNSMSDDSNDQYQCNDCDQIFSRKISLVMHRKTHTYAQNEPIKCEICGREFKMKGAYRTHMEKHKEQTLSCYKCHKCPRILPTNIELKRHLAEEHNQKEVVYECKKCERTFLNYSRFLRHKQGRCPGIETKNKKTDMESYTVGKDLFKAVAPLTTTYWSDSFSD